MPASVTPQSSPSHACCARLRGVQQSAPAKPNTTLAVVALIFLGLMMCCSGVMALGGFLGWKEAKSKASALRGLDRFDAGVRDDDDAAPLPDDAERDVFAQAVLDELDDEGHAGFRYDRDRFQVNGADGGMQMNLGNLYDEYALMPEEERPDAIKRFVSSLFPPELPRRWSEARAHVLPSVRDRLFLELLSVRADKPAAVVQRALTDDLVEAIVYDGKNSMQFVGPSQLSDWGITEDALRAEAMKNLRARTKKPFVEQSPGVWESPWADNYDLARVLLPELILKLKVKGEHLVFLPQRDHLIVTGTGDVGALEAAAELVSDALDQPRAGTGRGWKLTKAGLEPWVPEAKSPFYALHLEAQARDANEQKGALDEKFSDDGTDVFVGTTLFLDDPDGNPVTYAVWTKDADTLMPKAQFVVLIDLEATGDEKMVAAGAWDDVMRKAGQKMVLEEGYWPPRWRLKTFPDARTVKAIGKHPWFAKKSE